MMNGQANLNCVKTVKYFCEKSIFGFNRPEASILLERLNFREKAKTPVKAIVSASDFYRREN
jgi:hypothetical protein